MFFKGKGPGLINLNKKVVLYIPSYFFLNLLFNEKIYIFQSFSNAWTVAIFHLFNDFTIIKCLSYLDKFCATTVL